MWSVKLILISFIGLVVSRPQEQQSIETKTEGAEPQVEIERQLIHEVIPLSNYQAPPAIHESSQRKVDENTKEILEKIAEVNKKQGLAKKKPIPNYFHFPFSYARSQDEKQRSENFKFSREPFTNPILDYMEKGEFEDDKTVKVPSFRRPNSETEQHSEGMTDSNPDINSEDIIPGQYIKRKITHYQSVLMPNPYMFNMFNAGPASGSPPLPDTGMFSQPNFKFASPSPEFPNGPYGYPTYPYMNPSSPVTPPNKNRTILEQQTIDSIKDIILSGQAFPGSIFQRSQIPEYNTNNQNEQNYLKPQYYQGLPMMLSGAFPVNNPYLSGYFPNNPLNTENLPQQMHKARQNWNWPGANLFPIYVRDPFLQMYYAITNMIEYGPSAGNDGPCKLTPRPQGSRIKIKPQTTPGIQQKSQQVTLEMNQREGTDEIKVIDIDASDLTDDVRYLDVEDIDVGDDDLVKLTINIPKSTSTEGRGLRDSPKLEKMGWNEYIHLRNDTRLSHLVSGKIDFSSQPPIEAKQSPQITQQVIREEVLDEEPQESEKAEDISISNEGSRKVFSKDNTGNGIFIHKLKVRKGGVAIAGPGGIATAGSGGTAIVGPNGIAYTHPNGLAIAGSGTKVVAVDPSIDLNEVIKDSVLNGTRHVPNTRVGKVVAVGPVVYYNRG